MEYKLYELPYAFSGLEPNIDKETMEVHYSKHYRGYTEKLNKAVSDFPDYRIENLLSEVSTRNQDIRNNGGGYYNHSLFFSILTPGGNSPSNVMENTIRSNFGCSFSDFKNMLIKKGLSHFGSGWVWVYKDSDGKLNLSTSSNQDNPLMDISFPNGGTPILGIDLWEHSYYLKYKNNREEYLEKIIEILDWNKIEMLYERG
jgi:superoxide dismutase, Fe-Mn family